MSTLTIRLPDDKHERLKALARANSISVNKLIESPYPVNPAGFESMPDLAESAPIPSVGSEPRNPPPAVRPDLSPVWRPIRPPHPRRRSHVP